MNRSKFIELYNHCCNQFSNITVIPEKPPIPFAVNPHSHAQPQATTNLLSFSTNLPFLDISCKWILYYTVYWILYYTGYCVTLFSPSMFLKFVHSLEIFPCIVEILNRPFHKDFMLLLFSHSVTSDSLLPLWTAACQAPLSVLHCLPAFSPIHVYWVSDAI